MTAIITGDIINSRNIDATLWVQALKDVFLKYQIEKSDWQIYRGDSFQVLIEAEIVLELIFEIKAVIKSIKSIDVRMGIGLGTISFRSTSIMESNGTAFVHSGECFDTLKKHTIAIKSGNDSFDDIFNTIFQLVTFFADEWSVKTAQIVHNAVVNPLAKQEELAKQLNIKSQSSISAALKRGGFFEIKNVINLYKKELKNL